MYFHPRDEHGALVVPSRRLTEADFGDRYVPCATLEDELKQFEQLCVTLGGPDGKAPTALKPENVAQCVADIRAKWASGERAERRRKWEQEQARGRSDTP